MGTHISEKAMNILSELIKQKYLQKSDHQLSAELGITVKTVRKIRERYGLKRGQWTERKLELDESKLRPEDLPKDDPQYL